MKERPHLNNLCLPRPNDSVFILKRNRLHAEFKDGDDTKSYMVPSVVQRTDWRWEILNLLLGHYDKKLYIYIERERDNFIPY